MPDSESWKLRAKARAQDWRTIGERLRNQSARDRMLKVAADFERMSLIAAEAETAPREQSSTTAIERRIAKRKNRSSGRGVISLKYLAPVVVETFATRRLDACLRLIASKPASADMKHGSGGGQRAGARSGNFR